MLTTNGLLICLFLLVSGLIALKLSRVFDRDLRRIANPLHNANATSIAVSTIASPTATLSTTQTSAPLDPASTPTPAVQTALQGASQNALVIGQRTSLLSPAELAYLSRPGDDLHCFMVICIDLVHKSLKEVLITDVNEGIQVDPEIWNKIREYVKNWSINKTEQIKGTVKSSLRSPRRLVRNITLYRAVILRAISGLTDKAIRDPKHLKKLFSPRALITLTASLWNYDARIKLMAQIRARLLRNHFLVTDEDRQKSSLKFASLAGIQFVIVSGMVIALGAPDHLNESGFYIAFSLVNVILIKVLFFVISLIPFYEDFALALDTAKVNGAKLKIARTLLRTLRFVFIGALGIAGIALIVLQGALISLNSWAVNVLSIVLVSWNYYLILDSAFRARSIGFEDQLTEKGEAALDACRNDLKKINPIKAISSAVSDPEYTVQFTEFIALYGPETLVLFT